MAGGNPQVSTCRTVVEGKARHLLVSRLSAARGAGVRRGVWPLTISDRDTTRTRLQTSLSSPLLGHPKRWSLSVRAPHACAQPDTDPTTPR